jgi:hypothetical protein
MSVQASTVAAFEAAVRRANRRASCSLVVSLAMIGGAGMLVLGGAGRAATDDGILRVRGLIVEDANGVGRVVIGTNLPDPMLLGKRVKRGGALSGILLHDAEGNERGGYVTSDDGRGAALTLDELGRAAIHLGVGDRGDIHLTCSDGRGGWLALGVFDEQAFVRLDGAGEKRYTVHLPAKESDDDK